MKKTLVNWKNSLSKRIQKGIDQKGQIQEDSVVLDFLHSLPHQKHPRIMEVGAGLGRFAEILQALENDLSCLEINSQLVKKLSKKGFNVVNADIRNTGLKSESFDIIHCSHVIEHFGYPDITLVLDELLRLLSRDGYLIIRSPLIHPGFYNEIDHIRPYPPAAILQYFSNSQQQKKGKYSLELVKHWKRQEYFHLSHLTTVDTFFKWLVDISFKWSWLKFGHPQASPNGYVAIFVKK